MLVFLALLILFAVLGGAFISKVLWLLLVVALAVYLLDQTRR